MTNFKMTSQQMQNIIDFINSRKLVEAKEVLKTLEVILPKKERESKRGVD